VSLFPAVFCHDILFCLKEWIFRPHLTVYRWWKNHEKGKTTMAFVNFMASSAGRMLRVVAGGLLIALGLLVVKDSAGIILAVVGLVPLLAGIFDVCVFAPLFGQSFYGPQIRQR
jgi:hypothetical protein